MANAAGCTWYTYSSLNTPTLRDLYYELCHLRIAWMLQFIHAKNLPIATEEVKKVCSSCRPCAELKSKFFHMEIGTLIKTTQSLDAWGLILKVLYVQSQKIFISSQLSMNTPDFHFLFLDCPVGGGGA